MSRTWSAIAIAMGAGVLGLSTGCGAVGGIEKGEKAEEAAPLSCQPGTTGVCPVDAAGVGACREGVKVCGPDGTFGACVGQVEPAEETCDPALVDEDCDGEVNEGGLGCICVPDEEAGCYSALDPTTMGVGACKGGQRTCDATGLQWGECLDEVLPGIEDCEPGLVDEDCDGRVNEEGSMCVCTPVDDVQSCPYSGPVGTEGIGACTAGASTCDPSGVAWGACGGEVTPACETCAAGDANCDGLGCTGEAVWATTFGLHSAGRAVAVDTEGNIYITGYHSSTLGFGDGWVLSGTGAAQGFVAKFNAHHQVVWAKHLESQGCNVFPTSLAVAADGSELVIAGVFNNTTGTGTLTLKDDALAALDATQDIFVAKLDEDGDAIWGRSFGDSDVLIDPKVALRPADGSVWLVGTTYNVLSFATPPASDCVSPDIGTLPRLCGNGSANGFVVKLDTGGEPACRAAFTGTAASHAHDVAFDSTGAAVVVGNFSAAGGGAKFGGVSLPFQGGHDVVVAKLDEICVVDWALPFGDTDDQQAYGVAIGADDAITVAGKFRGDLDFGGLGQASASTVGAFSDIFVARLDPAGVGIWANGFGTQADDQQADDVAIDCAGNALIVGFTTGKIDELQVEHGDPSGGNDMFVAKLSGTDGLVLWGHGHGAMLPQWGRGIAASPLGDAVVVGQFSGAFEVGGTWLSGDLNGSDSAFLAHFAP